MNGNGNGIAAFLDLPIGSAISLDAGVVEIILKRDDFIGLHHLPSRGFHLISVRAAAASRPGQQQSSSSSSPFAATTVGFVLPTSASNTDDDAILVRRFNPQTEEVAATPPDDLTISNLIQQIRAGRIYPLERLLSYPQVLASSSSSTSISSISTAWTTSGLDRATMWQEHLVNFISPSLLVRRGIQPGITKIVPGTFEEWQHAEAEHDKAAAAAGAAAHTATNASPQQSANTGSTSTTTTPIVEDGTSVSYPGVPVIIADRHFPHHQQQQQHRLVNHVGTKRFLSTLSPTRRTQILTSRAIRPADIVLRHVLQQYYNDIWQDLLGDVQLSYSIFLQLRCYASLEHWRDVVAMMSSVSVKLFFLPPAATSTSIAVENNNNNNMIEQQDDDDNVIDMTMIRLYTGLLHVLSNQVRSNTMDNDFFDNDDFSGGNFFAPCNQRLLNTLQAVTTRAAVASTTCSTNNGNISGDIMAELASLVESYRTLLQHRLPALFLTTTTDEEYYSSTNSTRSSSHKRGRRITGKDSQQQDDDSKMVMTGRGGHSDVIRMMDVDEPYGSQGDADDDDDEDGPVVVSSDEVQAFLERMQKQELQQQQQQRTLASSCSGNSIQQEQRHLYQEQYPILFAAIMPHEDVLMTCARALDQASDVSLVREAAAYLEQVEAQQATATAMTGMST
jgi:AAR2 protein